MHYSETEEELHTPDSETFLPPTKATWNGAAAARAIELLRRGCYDRRSGRRAAVSFTHDRGGWTFDGFPDRYVYSDRGLITIRVVAEDNGFHLGQWLWRRNTRTMPFWHNAWIVSTAGPYVLDLGLADSEHYTNQIDAMSRANEIEREIRRSVPVVKDRS